MGWGGSWFLLGFRETVLWTVVLLSMMPPQQGCFSKHWGCDHLRRGLRTLMYFAPPARGFLSTYLLRAGTGPVSHLEQLGSPHPPMAQTVIHSGGREHPLWCYYPLLDGESTRIASPSISSCLRWDTAGQLAPMAAHGHATKGSPQVHGKQSCSHSPDSIQWLAALHCWYCHVHPFHFCTIALQPVLQECTEKCQHCFLPPLQELL